MPSPEIKACLIDLDGTVYNQGVVYPGVPEALRELGRRSIPYRYITNTTMQNRSQMASRLTSLGIPATSDQIFISPQAAALFCRKRGYERIQLVAADRSVEEEFTGLSLVQEEPEVVVLGDLGEDFTHGRLNAIFQSLMSGAPLIAMQKSRYWHTREYGLTLDLGPYVAALEYATGREAVVVGKPAREFFDLAVEGLGVVPEQVAVVGDSVENDVRGAQQAGLKGVLVKTGVYEPDQETALGVLPDAILKSLAHVHELLDG